MLGRLRLRRFVFADDIESAMTLGEVRLLSELARGKDALEIGSWYGRSTVALASVARTLIAVDPHTLGPPGAEDTLTPLLKNLDRYGVLERVDVRQGYAADVLPSLEARSFDIVFLDADHRREAVERDLETLLPYLRPGGTLAFHDYGQPGTMFRGEWDAWGVTEVVDGFAAARGLRVETVDALAVVRPVAYLSP